MAQLMVLSAISPFTSMAIAAALDLSAAQSLPLDLALKAGGTFVLGIFVLPRFTPAALIIAGTGVLLLAFPDYPLELTASGLAVAFIYIARGLSEMQGEEPR